MTVPALAPPAPAADGLGPALQDALGAFASGVTVVTTSADGEPYGMTVSAFSALSADPPLVLLCVADGSRALPLLLRSGAFCVNVLASSQEAVARRFASRRRPRGTAMFDGVPHRPGSTGAPVLEDAAAHLECELHDLLDGGDHTVVVGRVVHAGARPGARPLVVHRRELTTLADAPAAPVPSLHLVRAGGRGPSGTA